MTQIQNFKMFIDGEWLESSSGKKIETLNPEKVKRMEKPQPYTDIETCTS